MKKKYLFMATAAIMMAGCASDDLVGDENISNGETPIAFKMQNSAATRDGDTPANAADAGKLGNMFIVWGEKNESTDGTAASGANKVFQNYIVKYTSGTANTTSSNTENWEYVGVDHSKYDTNVISTIGSGTAQTIKYWDMKATGYTFTAVSADEENIEKGCVKITKTIAAPSGSSSVYDKGYTIELKKVTENNTEYVADASKIYIADRINLTSSNDIPNTINKMTENKYGGQVKFTFRNFQSKIRFGIYETVPGYKVVITGIKYPDATSENTTIEHPTKPTQQGETADKTFGIGGDFVVAGANTKYTVTYESTGANTNRAKVKVDDSSSKEKSINTAGTNWLSTHFTSTSDKSFIGEDASHATLDKGSSATDSYTAILPNPSNSTNLKLQISYDLYSDDTYEKIETGYHTVEVPASYCQWKSNYAYTYLFKISDKSAELYPITFDACVVETQIGDQETITEVSEPSITTMGVGTDNKVITGKDEYSAGSTIYASVVDGTTNTTGGAVALTATTNINLYTVATTNTDKTTITEAAVANCLAQKKYNTSLTQPSSPYENTDLNGYKLTVTSVEIKTSGTTDPIIVNKVPTEEGLAIATRDLNALKWTATGSTSEDTYYVVEYIKTDSSNQSKTYYKVIKVAKGS